MIHNQDAHKILRKDEVDINPQMIPYSPKSHLEEYEHLKEQTTYNKLFL